MQISLQRNHKSNNNNNSNKQIQHVITIITVIQLLPLHHHKEEKRQTAHYSHNYRLHANYIQLTSKNTNHSITHNLGNKLGGVMTRQTSQQVKPSCRKCMTISSSPFTASQPHHCLTYHLMGMYNLISLQALPITAILHVTCTVILLRMHSSCQSMRSNFPCHDLAVLQSNTLIGCKKYAVYLLIVKYYKTRSMPPTEGLMTRKVKIMIRRITPMIIVKQVIHKLITKQMNR